MNWRVNKGEEFENMIRGSSWTVQLPCTKSLRTYEIPRAVCIYAMEPYGEGLYLAMKEQADLETRSMSSLDFFF